MNKYIFQKFPSNSLLFGVHDYMQFLVFIMLRIGWCFTLFVLFGLPIQSYVLLLILSVRFGHRTTTCAFFSWKLYFYFLKHLLLVR
jgi:hypothetical protein